jgi:arginase family enzyme
VPSVSWTSPTSGVRRQPWAAGRFLTVDVDVLDPSAAPGTGTPEPGGMTAGDLLWGCRALAARLELVGLDVVEVLPTAVGSADVTALVADRIVREALTGIALRRRAD